MLGLYISTFLLFIFSTFNLLGIKSSLLVNHLAYYAVGLVGFFIIRYIGITFFKLNARFFYWLFIAILVGTFLLGIEVKGSKRWIDLFFFRFQPSEFFKIFFIIFLADFFSKSRRFVTDRGLFVISLAYFIGPTLIIFKQPDLGSALVVTFIFLVMMLFSGIPKKYLVYLGLLALLLSPLSLFFLHDYQKDRILSFFNPHIDQSGISYNMMQALITSGSGQFFGRGLGLGKQSHLYFLPEYHTDFAFSSLVEQFGFFGGLMLIIIYMTFSFFMIKRLIALYYNRDEQGKFKFFYTLGFFSLFVFQVFVNIGMNLGLLPIAGITLPLISYGGSSIVTFFMGLALL